MAMNKKSQLAEKPAGIDLLNLPIKDQIALIRFHAVSLLDKYGSLPISENELAFFKTTAEEMAPQADMFSTLMENLNTNQLPTYTKKGLSEDAKIFVDQIEELEQNWSDKVGSLDLETICDDLKSLNQVTAGLNYLKARHNFLPEADLTKTLPELMSLYTELIQAQIKMKALREAMIKVRNTIVFYQQQVSAKIEVLLG